MLGSYSLLGYSFAWRGEAAVVVALLLQMLVLALMLLLRYAIEKVEGLW
jgi:hypothetical protein